MRLRREWTLAYVLCAIVILNVIAIALLSSKLEQERAAAPVVKVPLRVPDRPLIRAVILEDTGRCPDCFDPRQYATALSDTLDLEVEAGDLAQWDARLAADSRDLPNARRLPAIAFNGSIEQYPQLINDWETVGYTLAFGSGPYEGEWHVLPVLNPPYLDRVTGEVTGRVRVIYLTQRSCAECFDPHEMREYLNRSRIVPHEESDVDASTTEGRTLLERYNITRVPTILLSPEAADYPGFVPGWDVVGSIESDGTLVLRDLQRIELTYQDLETGRVMKP